MISLRPTRSIGLPWPRLCRDLGGIAADRVGERIHPPDAQEVQKIALDRTDEPMPRKISPE